MKVNKNNLQLIVILALSVLLSKLYLCNILGLGFFDPVMWVDYIFNLAIILACSFFLITRILIGFILCLCSLYFPIAKIAGFPSLGIILPLLETNPAEAVEFISCIEYLHIFIVILNLGLIGLYIYMSKIVFNKIKIKIKLLLFLGFVLIAIFTSEFIKKYDGIAPTAKLLYKYIKRVSTIDIKEITLDKSASQPSAIKITRQILCHYMDSNIKQLHF